MSYSDLLNRMMEKDTNAFIEMTDRYGWSLYSAIRQKHPDKDIADRIYQDTMDTFYQCLQNPSCSDPVDAILVAFSERFDTHAGNIQEMVSEAPYQEDLPPAVHARPAVAQVEEPFMETQRPRRGSFWYGLGMILVCAGIAATLWVIAGLLMDMGVLPHVDLGYAWFNANIAPWF